MSEENNNTITDKIALVTNSLEDNQSEKVREKLINLINELINQDFNALIQLLYRIDVNEKKLKNLLNQNKNVDAASLITDLIIDRQLQKIAIKKQYSKNNKKSSEEEW